MQLKFEKRTKDSKVVKEIASNLSNSNGHKISHKQSLKSNSLSGEGTLAFMVEACLTRHQYQLVRLIAPTIYPSYKILQIAKKQCYPEVGKIKVTETSVYVDLQSLFDLTVERLIVSLKDVIDTLNFDEMQNTCLFSKWGFDGSSGHSSYKQAFYRSEGSDSAVFMTYLIPLRLVSNFKIIW